MDASTKVTNERRTESITVPLGDARRARVRLDTGVVRLHVTGAAAAGLLVSGTADVAGGFRVEQESRVEGETLFARVAQRNENWLNTLFNFSARNLNWNLDLSPAVPIDLTVRTGVGESELDLENLTLEALELNVGVGRCKATLPRRGTLKASVQSGVGELIVRIPAGVEARVTVKTGVGAVQVNGLFDRRGDVHTTPGYDTAADRVDLRVQGGVGRVLVERG